MDVKFSAEKNIESYGFWHCFWIRLFKMLLDIVHIRSLLFWVGSIFAIRFMKAYLSLGDKTPSQWLGIVVVCLWFLLAMGVGWNRTWEQVWGAFGEALKNYKKEKEDKG